MTADTPATPGEHVWVPADHVIRWPYCELCLVIKRADGKNKPCKGEAKMRDLEAPTVLENWPCPQLPA